MIQSHASASSKPPVTAGPLTAAMIGFGVCPIECSRAVTVVRSAFASAYAAKSSPAQKADPAPVTTHAPSESSWARSASASANAATRPGLSALRWGERFIVTVRTPASFVAKSGSCAEVIRALRP